MTSASVRFVTDNGTASVPTDYASVAPTTLSFAPGETAKTVAITVDE